MIRKKIIKMVLLITLIIISSAGGFMFGKGTDKKEVDYKEISNISHISHIMNIRVTSMQRMPSSGTAVALVIKNTTPYLIKQNSVYISYPIRSSENGQQMNKCKVEATGNKIDIKPNEEVVLNVFIQKENYENNYDIDSGRLQYEINGYVNEVSNLTHFQQSGGLEN